MYKIETDVQRNTLEILMQGSFGYNDGRELVAELSRKIQELKPGFKLLTDLSKLRSMDIEAYKSIDEIMELCNAHKVSKIIRVITKDTRDIGFSIMSLFHYSQTVIIHTCDSLEEAKQELGVF